jgi:histo-blood group ABO system transferase
MTALLVIATGDYIKYAENMIKSAKIHLLNGEFDVYLFTDKTTDLEEVNVINIEHKPWPYPTLMRYHIILEQMDILKKYDYLYYCDADMLFVDEVGEEIFGDIVVVSHPGFYMKDKSQYSYEEKRESTAFIDKESGKGYFAGGFNGGAKYLDMALQIKTMIDLDSLNNIVAVWHDESYLNKYVNMYGCDFVLTPSYCYPDKKEDAENWGITQFKPRLLAITK